MRPLLWNISNWMCLGMFKVGGQLVHSFCNVEEVGTGQPASSLQCPNRTVPSVMKTQQVQSPAEKVMTSVLYFMLHPVIHTTWIFARQTPSMLVHPKKQKEMYTMCSG